MEELNAKLGGAAFVIDVEADGIDLAGLDQMPSDVKAVEPGRCGHWLVEAERDIRPELARLIIAKGGSLRNLDLRRARLDQAYNRYFEEFSHDA